jgi:hypothetical protein
LADTATVTPTLVSIGNGSTTTTVNYASTGGALNLNLFTGNGGSTVGVLGTAANVTTNVEGGAGNDTVTAVLASSFGTPLAGLLNVDGGAGSNALVVDGSAGNFVDGVIVNAGSIFSNVTHARVNYAATGGNFGRGVRVLVGPANNVIDVAGTAAGAPVTIATGGGNNAVFLQPIDAGQNTTFHSAVHIAFGTGTENAIQLNETNSTVAEGVNLFPTSLFSLSRGFFVSYGTAPGGSLFGVAVLTGSGNDTVSIAGPPANGGAVFAFTGAGDDAIYTPPIGQLGIDAGPGNNALVITEAGLSFGDNVTVYDGVIGSNFGTVYFAASGGSFGAGLAVIGGNATDFLTLNSAPSAVTLYLIGPGGNDTITVNTTSTSNFTVVAEGGSGTNTLAVADTTGGGVIQNFTTQGSAAGEVVMSYPSGLDDAVFYSNIELVTNGAAPLAVQPI